MKGRILPAILIVGLMSLCCLLGPVPRLLFLLLCALAAVYEVWALLCPGDGPVYLGLAEGYVLLCALIGLHGSALGLLALSMGTAQIMLAAAAFTYRPGHGREALRGLALLIYPGCFFGAILFISQLEHWLWPFAAGVLTAWVCDSAALVAGTYFGKHPLNTPVSPRKTWEGVGAGLAAAVPVGLICWAFFGRASGLSVFTWMFVCLLLSAWGQVGDLAASLVKRALGVKDFSHLLGPHGGIMDKFDSMVYAIPLAYLLLHGFGAI